MITGTTFNRTVNDSSVTLCGGTDWDGGASITLSGKDRTNDNGDVIIRTKDNSNVSDFVLRPNGTATWCNKNLAMQEDYIPRSGGAVFTGTVLAKTDTTGIFGLSGGTTRLDGGSVEVYGKDNSNYPGWVVIRPADDNNYTQLILKPDGTAKWGSKYLAMQEDVVPRSGGAVLTPNITIGCVNNNGHLRICGGVNNSSGGSIQLNGKDTAGNKGYAFISSTNGTNTSEIIVRHDGETVLGGCTIFYSNHDNTTSLGFNNYRWKTVYSATSTINTSDLRLKNTISSIDDNLLDAWETIQPKQYKFNDASETKGEQARFHTGYLAQDIQKACTDNNLDISKYGLFCYDSWEEEPEIFENVEVEKDGIKTTEKRIVQQKREKGDMYALRYEEALVVECAYLRRENSRLKERLSKIEKLLNI